MQATQPSLIGVWVSGTRAYCGQATDIRLGLELDLRFQGQWTQAFQIQAILAAVIIGTFRYPGATP